MDVENTASYRGQFFRVLQETPRSQTAIMTIAPGDEAGPEEHHEGDQIIYVVEGEAIVRVGAAEHRATPGALITVPAGARHHVRNPGTVPLFFLTVYTPPAY